MGRYLSPTELWRGAMPKALSAHEFEAGGVSALVATVTGTGSLEAAWPRDAYASAVVRITTGGALGVARAALSLDAGATYGPSVLIPESGEVETPGRELVLRFVAGTYQAGDRWAFSTTASPELELHIGAAEDELDGLLGNALQMAVTSSSKAHKRHLAGVAVESLMRSRGIDPKSTDWQIYRTGRMDALQWARDVGLGQSRPVGLTETPPGVSFPERSPEGVRYATDYPI